MIIKNLPKEYRPREKAIQYGFDYLSDIELLAIILGSGTKDCNVIQLASNVLSYSGGLNGLMRTDYQSLKTIKGISTAKASTLMSIINIFQRVDLTEYLEDDIKIEQILDKYQKRLLSEKREILVLVILSRLKKIIKETIIAIGNDGSLTFSNREIFKEIYLCNGYSFYLIHTHPYSISYPSKLDIKETKMMEAKCKKLGIKLIDHYVIGTDGCTSINEFLKENLN